MFDKIAFCRTYGITLAISMLRPQLLFLPPLDDMKARP
jgi:hypothetical protein